MSMLIWTPRPYGRFSQLCAAPARPWDRRSDCSIGKRVLPASDTHIARAARESVFSVLICGPNEHVREHRTLIVWKDRGEFWFCASDRLPIALFPKQAPSLDGNVGQIDTAVRFPVDAVYTWVNSEDPGWRALLAPFRELTPLDRDRFGQSDELRYSMRSLALFAPWIRRIYIVSNCARPDWLLETARVAWVDHSEIIPGDTLPTFNSHAIETFLHRIEGLSEQFLYLNDDVMFSAIAHKEDFFSGAGTSIARLNPYGSILNTLSLFERGVAADWQRAAVNSAQILQKRFGVLPTRMHCHAPFALRRDVYRQMEYEFPEAFKTTRSARFRQVTDVSFTSFFYHHYAAAIGKGQLSTASTKIVRPTNYRKFAQAYWDSDYRSFCLNDGAGSSLDAGYTAFKHSFPAKAFPVIPPWEK